MNIFVAKLDYATKESTVRDAFEAYGEVSSVKVITDKVSGRSKGYAFVEMDNDEEGEQAIKALNETELDGRTIVVKKSLPKSDGYGDSRNRRRNDYR
jgi:RNA recognition motif-containing protein